MKSRVLVCVATPMEGALLGARGVPLLVTGIGPVNAAHALTREFARRPAGAVVSCGIGGAYPGAGLSIGDVVCAKSECYADLGAESPEGFLDMEALGFAVLPGKEPLFNRLPLDLFPAERRVGFATLSTCTGTDETARRLEARTGAAVESMEGAAIVHVARLHDLPVGEIRGISNHVGRRERDSWKLMEAAEAAQLRLLEWLDQTP